MITAPMTTGSLVDVHSDVFSGIWMPGYRIIEYEAQGTVIVAKEGNGPLDNVPIRLRWNEIRPTSEDPNISAQRLRDMAADRCKARRAARKLGLSPIVDTPIRFVQGGAYVQVTGEIFVSLT